uniref:Uncharacterized protein n=1 Tax=Labrus bergylta TaxID=56723 RepID=A0A3Q3H3J6_9LABR
MADPAKSSQTAKNVVIALLALWSIISLVVIVVWSTSPDLKSSAQCRAELQDKTEKLEGVKVVCRKDKVALEEQVEAEREEQVKQGAEILLLLAHLNATNATLEESRQENVSEGFLSLMWFFLKKQIGERRERREERGERGERREERGERREEKGERRKERGERREERRQS